MQCIVVIKSASVRSNITTVLFEPLEKFKVTETDKMKLPKNNTKSLEKETVS